MDNNEIWKPIDGFDGKYEVSNMGNVRRAEWCYTDKDGRKYKKKPYMRIPQIGSSGYLQVGLFRNGKSKAYKVHRLVASAFIDNPENKPTVDHINANRQDNRVENLRWCTLKENSNNPISLYRHSKGYAKPKRAITDTCKKTTSFSKSVSIYNKDGEYVRTFPSIIAAEQATGVDMSGIRRALDKSYMSAGGFVWKTDKVTATAPYKRRRHTKCRTIMMLDMGGNVVKEWDAVRDAAKELNTTHTRILRYMNDGLTMDGYVFKYKNILK